jgi:hypothetical protein
VKLAEAPPPFPGRHRRDTPGQVTGITHIGTERSGSSTVHSVADPVAYQSAHGAGSSEIHLIKLLRALALPIVAFAVYAAIGWKLVVLQHVVVPDGWSRLAHAYFVFYGYPEKLAAIGFIWPPMLTLVLLPFAVVKPLATSLMALPLMSATFGAGVLVVLDRILALARMRPAFRYPLLAAFGLNPMILFYATNGMGEIVSLFFLTVAAYALLSWYVNPSRRLRHLVMLSLALTLGFLSRYEQILWVLPAMFVVFGTILINRVRSDELQAWFIAFVAPIVYGLGLWLLANWMIVGTPFYWLHAETSTEIGVSVTAHTHPSLTSAFYHAVGLNAHLFFPAIVAFAVLAVVLAFRHDIMTAGILSFLIMNALFSAGMFYVSDDLQYFELRYNIRAIPITIACIAWLYLLAKSRRQRMAVWCVSLIALIAAIPFTWQTMATSNSGFLEDAFVNELLTIRDATGETGHVLGSAVPLGVQNEAAMAAYIRSHISERNSILTDDDKSFGVILFDGRADIYWTRISKGDAAWWKVLNKPWGVVKYLLVSPEGLGGGPDLAFERYPALASHGLPGFTRVYGNVRYVLYRVAAHDPRRAGPGSEQG